MKKALSYLLIVFLLFSSIPNSSMYAITQESTEVNIEDYILIELLEDILIHDIKIAKGTVLYATIEDTEVAIQFQDSKEFIPLEKVNVIDSEQTKQEWDFINEEDMNFTPNTLEQESIWSSREDQASLHINASIPFEITEDSDMPIILIGNIAFYQMESNKEQQQNPSEKENAKETGNIKIDNQRKEIEKQNTNNDVIKSSTEPLSNPWQNSNSSYFEVIEENVPIYDNRTGKLVKVAELVKGETYPIHRDYGNWHEITYGSIKAYVLKSKTVPSQASAISNENKGYKTINRTITIPNKISVYDNSGTSLKEYGYLEKGSSLKVTRDYGNWWRIIFAGRVGYVQKSEVQSQFLKTDKYFMSLESELPIYDNRTGKLVKVGELTKGESYAINRDYGNWHEIKFGNYYGYVHKSGTTPSTGSAIRNKNVSYTNLNRTIQIVKDTNVYDNTSGELVEFGSINKNTKISILRDYGNWWRILFGDRVGYISKADTNIDFINSDQFFRAEENLPIYDNRTGQLVEIGNITKGQTYKRVSDYGNWHRIQFNNHYGYVHKTGTSVAVNPSIPNLNKSFKQSKERFRASVDLPVYDNSSGKLVQFGTIHKNQTYFITSNYGNWYRIVYSDRIGYIHKDLVTGLFNKSTKYFQAQKNAPIYDNRSGSLVKIGEINAGQAYERVRDYGNWHQIRFGNYYGYIHKNGTLPLNTIVYKNRTKNTFSLGTLTAKRNTTIYDNTGAKLTPFASLQSGKKLPVTRDYGNWLEVNVAGRYGYVSKNDVNANIMKAKNIVNPKTTYTYEMMQQDITQLKNQYPGLISSKIIGKSVDGRNIYAVKLGRGKTEIFMNGSHHAREWLTTNLLMEMIDTYSQAYVKNTTVAGYNARQILNNASIWFVPMVNPDGVTLVQKGAFSAKRPAEVIRINGGSTNFNRWKANIRGVDLNRQYPADWAHIQLNRTSPSYMNHKGRAPLSEPETRAVYNFTNQRNFKTAVSYHSSGEVLYWNYKLRSGSSQRALSYRLAKMIGNKTGYRLVNPGSNPSGGGYTDWFIQGKKLPAFTPEISPPVGERPVPVSYFDSIWRKNQSIGLMLAEEAYKR